MRRKTFITSATSTSPGDNGGNCRDAGGTTACLGQDFGDLRQERAVILRLVPHSSMKHGEGLSGVLECVIRDAPAAPVAPELVDRIEPSARPLLGHRPAPEYDEVRPVPFWRRGSAKLRI